MARTFRTAVVTGASSGIGNAIARQLLEAGTSVAILARRTDRLERLAKEFPGGGEKGKAISISADVTDPSTLASAALEVDREMSEGIDLLVGGAGLGYVGPATGITAGEYRLMFETNVLGLIETVRAFLPAVERRKGTIAALSSLAGRIGSPGMAGYCSTKFAVHGFLDSLRFELHDAGVAVVEICPGAVDTELFGGRASREKFSGGARLLGELDINMVARKAIRAAERRSARVTIPRLAGFIAWTNDAMPSIARPIQRIIERS